jgi:citrate lyase subunit beta / citryl-CoA lyase
MTDRPMRSVLYLPGSNLRALEKARTLPCDALIFDLEDAVAPDAKLTARRQVVEALTIGGFGDRLVLVRVNGLKTEWGSDDLRALSTSRADGIVLPKVETVETLRQAETLLRSDSPPLSHPLWAMIETPAGVLNVAAIAGYGPRLSGLILGLADLAKDLRCQPGPHRLPLHTAMSMVLLAGRAFGLVVLDGVQLTLNDDAALEAACQQGRDFGFDGKTLIHPAQISTANRIFAPQASELEQARRLIHAHSVAQAEGRGVTVVDGRLVETLHVEEARRLLALAETLEERSLAGSAGP